MQHDNGIWWSWAKGETAVENWLVFRTISGLVSFVSATGLDKGMNLVILSWT